MRRTPWKVLAMVGLGALAAVWIGLTAASAAEDRKPERIVSLSGSLTETVVALGLGDELVGVDLSSLRPAEVVRKLPRLGSPRAVPLESVLNVGPTVVIAYDDLEPRETVPQLQSLGIRTILLPRHRTVESARLKFLAIADGLGVPERGRALVAEIDRDLAWPEGKPEPDKRVRALFVQTMGSGPLMIGGDATSATSLLEAAHVANAVSGFEGYRPFNVEAMIAVNPEAVVILKRALDRVGGIDGLAAMPGLAETDAVRQRRIVVSDDAAFLGLGPGVGRAVRELREAMYGR